MAALTAPVTALTHGPVARVKGRGERVVDGCGACAIQPVEAMNPVCDTCPPLNTPATGAPLAVVAEETRHTWITQREQRPRFSRQVDSRPAGVYS